ncbi:MAG: T9SS type A sorting domain-containing protein, partial [Candidatus Cloacimonetes bacterium]|nr:T9SS type A sorting domain-containing protein [Candidatus Cloacimonadota bacterium]
AFNGSILMCIEDPVGGPEELETWTIFGDASLNVRTDSPAEVTLSNESIFLDVDYTTTVTSDGSPLKGALVSFYQNGVGFTGVSDASGNVIISHELEAGNCTMVVSSYNGITIYNEDITVVPAAGAYCICVDNEYGDGNNSIPEYNENGSFSFTISNVGEAQADNVKLTLTTESDFVTITGAYKNIGNIAADSSIEVEDAFVFEIAGNIPDQEIISFNLEMKGQETWNSELGIIVNAPVFEIGEMVIEDSGNDGRLDSGETAVITVPVKNIGHAASLVGSAMLSSSNSEVINVTSATSDFTTLDAATEANVVFNVSVADNVPLATVVTMNFILNSGECTANKNFYPSVGRIFEEFESGDFSSLEWINGTPGWQVVDSNAYEGSYCAQSVDIDHSQTAILHIDRVVEVEGEISFWQKTSCEDDPKDNNYDYLAFFINDVEQGRWDGKTDWSKETFVVPTGDVAFEWRYVRDNNGDGNDDCVWIDNIVFPGLGGSIGPVVSINEDSLQFGEVSVNKSSMNDFTILSLGSEGLTGSITAPEGFNISLSRDGEMRNELDYAVEAGSNVTVYVVFEPVEVVEYAGDIIVTSNDSANPSLTVAVSGTGLAVNTGDDLLTPKVTSLAGNFPNPFNPTTTIKFSLAEAISVSLDIFNIKGQKVNTLINSDMAAGHHSVVWNGKDKNSKNAASGIYFYVLKAGKNMFTKKMILMK